MTLYQFILLESPEQIDIIAKCAVEIDQRIDGDYTYKLLQLDNFYIEEAWHTKFNERRSYTSFISEDKLMPYLKQMT